MLHNQFEFTKSNLDTYLKDVAKEYRKKVGKRAHAELILVGGASVLINYNFRYMTTDIDALIFAASAIKDAINYVRDFYDLPNNWLNEDFVNTASYSDKLPQFSTYYKTYSNVITVRTIAAEYLIAMKLQSARQYKSDLSDILGILLEHEEKGQPISMDSIRKAVVDLYGDWLSLPETSRMFIENAVRIGNYESLYGKTARTEKLTRERLLQFEHDYPGVAKQSNILEIIESLQKKEARESVLESVRQRIDENKQKKQKESDE